MSGDDRERQTTGNVRQICPCETQAENPAPHIPTCPWADPDYVPAGGFFPAGLGEEAMRAAAADALGIEPHEVAIVRFPLEDPAMAEVAPSRISMPGLEVVSGKARGLAGFEEAIADADEAASALTLPRRLTLPARSLDEIRAGYGQADHAARDREERAQLGRMTGAQRGELAAGGLILRRPPPFERCPWVKIAGTAEQVRCLRAPHDTEEDCQNHDWTGPLEARQPLATSRGAGTFAPPVVRVEVTGEPGTVGWLRARLEGVPDDMPVTVRAWDEDGGDVCGGLTGAGVEHAHDEDDTAFFALDSSPDEAEEVGS